MTAIDRRTMLAGLLGGAVVATVGSVFLPDAAEAASPAADKACTVTPEALDAEIRDGASRTQFVSSSRRSRGRWDCWWHRGRRICRERRWTCWWRNGRRVCGWR